MIFAAPLFFAAGFVLGMMLGLVTALAYTCGYLKSLRADRT